MRYRFRTLLILLTLVACGFGAGTHYVNRYRAICVADKLGVTLTYEGQATSKAEPQWRDAFKRVEAIRSEQSLEDERLRYVLSNLWDVRKVEMKWGRPAIETARVIGRLPSLEEFDFGLQWVEHGELEAICQSSSLKTIYLGLPVNDLECEALGKSRSLRKLSLPGSRLRGQQILALNAIPDLDFLLFTARLDLSSSSRDAIETLLTSHPKLELHLRLATPEEEERSSYLRQQGREKTPREDKESSAWWNGLRERHPGCVVELK
jgi:hypothetical protein